MKRERFGVALLGAALLILTFAVPAGAAPSPRWFVDPSPNRAGVSNGLNDVACPTASRCIAVGEYHNDISPGPGPTPAGTLIETLNAGSWRTNTSPGQDGLSRLLSISCPSASRCYAIGTSHTGAEPLLLTSAGGPWSAMSSPPLTAPSDFASISCGDETHCIAVGFAGPDEINPVILRLANGIWSVAPLPDLGSVDFELKAVSCVSATRCVIVGQRWTTTGRTLALKLSGGTWSVMPTTNRTANSNWFNGISCTSATRCTAIGAYTSASRKLRTLIGSWDGTTWTLVPSPNRGLGHHGLLDISCAVASRCLAVGIDGNGRSLLLRLADGTWSIEPSPQLPWDYVLNGVDCFTASACVAVGSHPSANPFISRTLVLRSGPGFPIALP